MYSLIDSFKHLIQYCLLPFILVASGSTMIQAQVKTDTTSASDTALLRLIESQMNSTPAETAAPQVTRSSLNFNPDIGVIGDFRGAYSSAGKRNAELYLNETEISLQAPVDPYLRADFFVTFGRDPQTGKYGAAIEEGYLTTQSLPARLQLKAGKFRQAVGRINSMHPHALPFIDMPDAYVNYFGEEGLNDEGLSLSWLLPTKKVYQELIVQATSGYSESPAFSRSQKNRFVYLAHLKNFFTLSDNATLEMGVTGISGPNDSAGVTNLATADLTYKWKPVRMNTYRSLTWQSEFFFSHIGLPVMADRHSMGLYSFLQYQVAKRWFLTGRYDYAQEPDQHTFHVNAFSLTAGWLATEFSKMEFEGKATKNNFQSSYFQAWLRWIFIIGAHGAHQY
jgi:hypothetical protein